MAAAWNKCLAFGFMAVTNEELDGIMRDTLLMIQEL
jgi:hypothetical protein